MYKASIITKVCNKYHEILKYTKGSANNAGKGIEITECQQQPTQIPIN